MRPGYLLAKLEDENWMHNPAGLRCCTVAVIAVLLLLMPIGTVQGANPTDFAVTVIGQTLTAGFNNNVTIAAAYPVSAYSSGSVYDVDLAVSIPSPLQMLGDDHWHYDSISPRQSVTVSFEIYAPTAAIGSSYQGSVTLTYRELGDISYTEESHSISFSVQGWVNLVLYGIQVTPSATSAGGNATVSGNLLNSGNLVVYNANVTVESEALAAGSSASVFLGEVDPNIPRPFSLLIKFEKSLADGIYPIVVKISAVDTNRPASPYGAQQASQIQIKKATVQPPSGPRQTSGVVATIFEILRYLYGLFFGSATLAMSSGYDQGL
jgi:hypothetical protein